MDVIRARWVTIAAAVAFALAAAALITLTTTPRYQASTRLFVSTATGDSVTDVYQGGLFSQQRVLSYSALITGETMAQRTVDKLGLDLTAAELQSEVSASAKTGTVLIDVSVVDPSPVRARDIANTLSDEFVLMVKDLETPANGSAPNARVVVEQRAAVPEEPVTPRKGRNMALGLAVGLLLGVGVALVRDRLDNTVKDRQTLEETTGLGVVGTIPMDKERRKEPAISFDRDQSSIAEAFRKLRTNLQFLSVDSPPRVIAITSSLPEEGKSTTVVNLALALAEGGNNVVVVDGDMRRPKLAQYLGAVESVGFSTVLSGTVSLDDALQETRFPKLALLAAGVTPPNPSELLGSVAAQKVLSDLRSRFDFVIVDSSPLLAVTDGAILANTSDGVLVIARFGYAKREQLAHAIRNLGDVGATVLGAVFTMTPGRGAGSYSYNYNYYGESQSQLEATESPSDSN